MAGMGKAEVRAEETRVDKVLEEAGAKWRNRSKNRRWREAKE